ncbi:MAG: InlB B-repeat-containing protein, partial [Firmicutes bacterium]|nr:InlB B-repeat-containing protein [Bacillota bacterium]
NVTWYAKWQINRYTLTFAATSEFTWFGAGAEYHGLDYARGINNGAVSINSITQDWGSTYTVNLNIAPFVNIHLATGVLSLIPYYQNLVGGRPLTGLRIGNTVFGHGTVIQITSNQTVYLVYGANNTANNVTINYNSANGSPASKITNGRGSTVGAIQDVVKNYHFLLGYHTSNINWANTSGINLLTKSQVEAASVTNGQVTYFAIWEPITIAFNYNSNSGTGSASSASTKFGTSNYALATVGTMVRSGHISQGWSQSSAGAGQIYNLGGTVNLTAESDIIINIVNYSVSNATKSITITLYMIWDLARATIAYNNNGGTGTISSQTVAVGSLTNLSNGSGFSKQYHALVGWALTAGATTATYSLGDPMILVDAGVTVTFYAVWVYARPAELHIPTSIVIPASGTTSLDITSHILAAHPDIDLSYVSSVQFSGSTSRGTFTKTNSQSWTTGPHQDYMTFPYPGFPYQGYPVQVPVGPPYYSTTSITFNTYIIDGAVVMYVTTRGYAITITDIYLTFK